ncbi:carbohydrate ABC transporter permease [uncultured Subdoligranulum sp.]|uniref:carbohydrate ABC transporter permease n=1 Tax=uncultured Subdoligranulum sp. TaxID=512298 RepID=UPI0025E70786|nr:carbohydrate ABC transporter permease [uncultured Subdoligranulum sp.]
MIESKTRRAGKFVVAALVIFFGVVIFIPFLFMFSSSMRTPAEAYKLPPAILPERIMLDNYITLFQSDIPFLQMFLNSGIVTGSVIIGRLFVGCLAAYATAKINFKGRNVVFVLFLLSMMLPIQATIIPTYIVMSRLHLVNTLWALIIPGLFDAFSIFLLRQSMATIPNAIIESAKIDGASHFRICWQIMVPMVKSTLVTLVVLSFNGVWNDYFAPYIYLSDWDKMTVPLGVVAMKGYMGSGNPSVVLAGVSIAVLPILIVFLFGQRYIVEGLTSSAVKG